MCVILLECVQIWHFYRTLFRGLLFFRTQYIYSVSQKNTPDIFSCNLNRYFPIEIIFGTSITQSLGNRKVVYFRTSPKQCFCTTLGNQKVIIYNKIKKKQKTASVSGVSRSIKNGRCCAFLRRTRGKSRQQIFPGCSSIATNVTRYQTCCG